MARVLIIGYGNRLRGDDGIGPVIAEELQKCLSGAHLRILALHQLGPELAQDCSEADLVVFIDAVQTESPGEVSISWLRQEAARPDFIAHYLEPQFLLTAAKQWYGKAPAAALITVGGANFKYETELSPEVTACTSRIVAEVAELVQPWLHSAA